MMSDDVIIKDNVILDTNGMLGNYLNGKKTKTFPVFVH